MIRKLAFLKDKKLNVLRDITDEEYLKLISYQKVLADYLSKRHLFEMVKINHNELVSKIEYYERYFSINRQFNNEKINDLVLDVNRLLFNFLTIFRTYLDHWETNLKRNYGKNSEEFKIYETARSKEFDEHFSYRFFNKLRNYSQHCGIPISNVNRRLITDVHANKEKVVIAIRFDKTNLINNYSDWGAVVKKDFEGLPDLFDIKDNIYDILGCVQRIDHVLKKIRHDRLVNAFKV